MGLKLYGLPMSTCTTRVMTCLHEKQVDFELVPVNLFTGDHKKSEFLAKNPFGQIPVLEDGDFTIFESRAIATYISTKFKDSGSDLLKLDDLKESTMVKVWMEVESQQFNPTISTIVYQFLIIPKYGGTTDHTIIDTNVEKLGKVLDVYEAQLAKTEYLAGDFFSLADLNHLSYTHYFMTTPWAALVTDRPHVKAWWDDISSRPAFKKVSANMTLLDRVILFVLENRNVCYVVLVYVNLFHEMINKNLWCLSYWI